MQGEWFMKNKLLIIVGCLLIVSLITLIVVTTTMRNYVDTSSATEVSLKYNYNDRRIDSIITDENDIRIIKENLKGVSYKDNSSHRVVSLLMYR